MAGLITDNTISQINGLFVKLHDTFTREITVYKNAKQVIISSSPNFNALYGNVGTSTSIENQTVSQKFMARIHYLKMEEGVASYDEASPQNKIVFPNGSIRIIVDSDGFEFIKESRKVEFDGKTFSIKSDGLPMGLFAKQHYQFYLIPIDE